MVGFKTSLGIERGGPMEDAQIDPDEATSVVQYRPDDRNRVHLLETGAR